MSEAEGVEPAGDWFAAELNVPVDVAVLNFVVQYYEHYDNNYGQDFKAAVQVDSKGRSVALSQCCTSYCLPAAHSITKALACCSSRAEAIGCFQSPLKCTPCDVRLHTF